MLIDSDDVEICSRSDAAEALLDEVYSGMVRDEELFASVVDSRLFDVAGRGGGSGGGAVPGLRSYAVLRDGVSVAVEAVVGVEREIAGLMARRARLVDDARRLAVQAEEVVFTPSVLERGSRVNREGLARRSLVAELGCALRLPEASVHRLLTESEALANELPSTLGALSEGHLNYRHAHVMVDNALSIPAAARLGFEGAALRAAVSLTAAQFTQKARKLRERLHPESMVARREKAAADRCVRFEPARDGMAWLNHYLPAAVAVQIDETLEELARGLQSHDEPRTHAQLRSDALVDLVLDPAELSGAPVIGGRCGHDTNTAHTNTAHTNTAHTNTAGPGTAGSDLPVTCATGSGTTGFGTAGSGPDTAGGTGPDDRHDAEPEARPEARSGARLVGQGVRPTVIVTVPVMTLLGHTDEPGELGGYGPIDAETARELARHAPSFIRILTHPVTGATLSVGRQRYKPPADLRTALRIDDETCRFPGCARAAHRCELDHTVDWAIGGETGFTNLAHLCPKHHHLKHETKWAATPGPDRSLHWTSPLGREYTTTTARPDLADPDLADPDLADPDSMCSSSAGPDSASSDSMDSDSMDSDSTDRDLAGPDLARPPSAAPASVPPGSAGPSSASEPECSAKTGDQPSEPAQSRADPAPF